MQAEDCLYLYLLKSYVVPVKSKVKISQNFVTFSEYMNFWIQKFQNILAPLYTVVQGGTRA